MGRWGYTLFQGDTDLDIVSEVEHAVGVALHEPTQYEEARAKLDGGLGNELMSKYREKETKPDEHLMAKGYSTLILGAYMMHVGAKISPGDREHLSAVHGSIPSRNGYVWPLGDNGFRDPGKVQYKAALDNYVDGQRRDFHEASCYNCGKISSDLAPAQLKRCVGCEKVGKVVSYCDKECQKENWKKHKGDCGHPTNNGAPFRMMNV